MNFDIMIEYVGSVRNLALIMTALRTPKATIQYEAFHVFKVFVANPNKEDDVKTILDQNAEKLIEFLAHFLPERGKGGIYALSHVDNEQQFVEEKKLLISMLRKMIESRK